MKNSHLHHRYSRHINIETVGLIGQQRLQEARVLVIGAGGLGAPVALYLAAAGIGKLGLVDPDFVDESNLQRQILFTTLDQGKPKVEAGRARLQELNPLCDVEIFQNYFDAQNAESILNGYDLVIDGSDNFATKFLICDVAHKLSKPMVFGAVDQFEGQVGLFYSRKGSCYRCLVPQRPKAKIRNCAEAGVIGALVGVIGSLQATLAINWIVSQGQSDHPLCPPIGKLMLMKLDDFDSFKFQVTKKNNCPTCSREPDAIVLNFESPQCRSQREIEWSQAQELFRSGRSLLVDVREQGEWEEFHIEGAHHWPLSQIMEGKVIPLPTDKQIIFYCKKGLRSLEAINSLQDSLSGSLLSLRGGLEAIENIPALTL